MKVIKMKSLNYILLLLFVACSTGHCRRGADQVLEDIEPTPPSGFEQKDLGSIRVAKPDGSLQCNMREGITLESMAKKELKGVNILASEKMNDGLMRIQQCGTPTGMINIYTIPHKDLRVAQKAGFELLSQKKE